MNVDVLEFGTELNRLLVVDDFLPDAGRFVDVAAALAPFPPEGTTAYPGLRHQVSPDQPAADYARAALQAAVPVLQRVFDIGALRVLEVTFSVLTQRPADLKPMQRLPHRDSTDPNHFALLHHLHDLPGTGTSFYRHRRTGFERLTEQRRPVFDEAVAQDTAEYGPPAQSYFSDADPRYEVIHKGAAKFNRMLAYRGSLFHSGYIPDDFAFDPDPRSGRLVAMLCVLTAPRAR